MPKTDGSGDAEHWFEPLAEHLGATYLRYSFTKGTGQEIDALIDMVEPKPGARILDVGCGPGRHSLELARRGYDVVGVDISTRFVELATAAAEAEELRNCRFQRLDAAAVGREFGGDFDLVISLCQGGFGLAGGPGANAVDPQVELDEAILRALGQAATDGGRVVVSAFSAYFQIRYFDEGANEFDAASGVHHEWTSIKNDEGIDRPAELWTTCFTPRELRLLARSANLTPLAVFGVTPGEYGPFAPTIEHPEFLLIAESSSDR